jgi:glycosyltransferase involved in cell wall biosynthesis
MRIGVDGGCLANRRGFGRFARQVLRALAEAPTPHEVVVLLDRPSADQVQIPDRCETVLVDVREAPSRAASAQGRRRVADLFAMGRAAARLGLDLIYFPATYSFFPVWKVPRVVVTMHDTLALAHPKLVFPTWAGRVAWTVKEHAAARWADAVVTVSQAARRDLIHWFGLDPKKVHVVSEGAEAIFRPMPAGPASDAVLARYRVPIKTPFLLYVGGLSPHKNLPRLIEAFARTPEHTTTLVLVGDFGDVFHTHVPALREAVHRLGLGERVRFPGFVPDDDLAYLYSRALALVQPSLMEGFGLPPVEAMACGTPVLYSRAGSLPEVIGEAGLAFDPYDVEAIATCLRTYMSDPGLRERLVPRALERAGALTWSAAAQTLWDCFEDLAPACPLRRSA